MVTQASEQRTNTDTARMRIDAIRVGSRHRTEMGDIAGLARSIRDVGLLHPVVVTPEGELIAGARRLAACAELEWIDVPVTVVPLYEVLRGEWAENRERKDFTPSEAVAIGRVLERIERDNARERQAATRFGVRAADGAGQIPPPSEGRTREVVGRAVGFSGKTYERAKAVVVAAEQDPETFGPVLEQMDRTGKVWEAYKAVKKKHPPVPRPAPSRGKSRPVVAERDARIAEMARQGYREESIAEAVGLDVTTVRRKVHEAGIPAMWQKVGKSQLVNADRVMDGLVSGAEPSEVAIRALDWAALDRSRLGVWEERLTNAIRALTQLRNKLRETADGV
jgi:ParB family transcriptional regulator, chromosome partitioning protein